MASGKRKIDFRPPLKPLSILVATDQATEKATLNRSRCLETIGTAGNISKF